MVSAFTWKNRFPLRRAWGAAVATPPPRCSRSTNFLVTPPLRLSCTKWRRRSARIFHFFCKTSPPSPSGGANSLRHAYLVLIHPGFGISTAWAYQHLALFPQAQNGQPGRAAKLAELLQAGDSTGASRALYNSLEAPALDKFPLLQLFQDYFRASGAWATLMSGSGSTTFAVADSEKTAQLFLEGFKTKFGDKCWTAAVPMTGPA